MGVNELMKLKRPLTDEELAFMEQEVLKLAQQLQGEVDELTRDLDPSDADVARLRAAPGKITRNIESAIECRTQEVVPEKRRGPADVVYSWEKLPVYAWINEFARVIGRLLATLPPRLHLHAHNLAGQATLISNCIAMGHRDNPPGETTPKEELRAYRYLGYYATFTVMEMLEELSRITKQARGDVAHGMTLIGKIREHFDGALAELDDAARRMPRVVH